METVKKIYNFLTFLIKLLLYAMMLMIFVPLFALAILLTFDSKERNNY